MITLPPSVRTAIATLVLIGCRDIHAPDQSSGYRLEIIPPNRAIALKEQVTLQVAAYTYSGFPIQVPPLTWSSSDASVASVDANGVVTGLALGYAVIKAVGDGMTGYLSVQIRPAALRIIMTPAALTVGDTGIVSVMRLDFNGDVIPGEYSGPWWESEESDVAEFARWPGLAAAQLGVIARKPGSLLLWADGTGVYGSLLIIVTPATTTR